MKRVLVTYNMLREGYKELCEKYDVTFPPDGVEAFSYDEVAEIIDQYDALQPMFNFKVDKKLLDAGKKLKIVSNYAVGYDNIDVDHATKLGIQVTNTPGAVTAPTADLALGLMIDVCRKMSEVDRKLRNNTIKVELLGNLGQSLSGRTLGIIGMGRIGKALARRAIACDMKIVYYNRNRVEQNVEEALNAKYLSLDELLKEADIVSINAPYTPQTHHIIGERELQLMKPTSILINTARGPLVDEHALAAALKEGVIWGAGLDVFEFGDYPIKELLELENAVLTPHIGTQTIQVRNEMAYCVSENIINFFEQKGEITKVNHL